MPETTLQPSGWLRWFVPPIRDLIFVVLLLSFCVGNLSQRLLRDGGTGWHIRTGQRILATHVVPRTDPFSISNAGKTWFAWEWLYEVGLGAIYNRSGLNGAVAATGLVIALTFAWLFSIMRRRRTDLATALVFLLLSFAASALHLYVRPHVISWLLTLLWWFLLESARENRRLLLLWLPPLMALWVNIHGGFLFGFALLAIYDLDAMREFWKAPDSASRRWLGMLSLSTLFCVAATFVNPYTYHLHTHIYQYLNDSFLMHHIQEFQRPNFRDLSPICFAFLASMALAGIAAASPKPSFREIGVLGFAIFAGLFASRNLPVSSILIAAVAAPFCSKAWLTRWRRGPAKENSAQAVELVIDRLGKRDETLRGGLWPVAALLVVLWMVVHQGYAGQTKIMNAHFDGDRFPVAAVDYLQKVRITEPLWCVDQWGGYLIYRDYPAILVDDRHDLYGDDFFRQYLKVVLLEHGWQEALDQTGAALALIPSKSPLAAQLQLDNEWKERYRDPTATLFERVR